MMRSGNPALRDNTFTKVRAASGVDAMTIQGTVNKTFILLFLTVFSASWVWIEAINAKVVGNEAVQGNPRSICSLVSLR